MIFEKDTVFDNPFEDIINGCKCDCGCNVCNSQSNPKESNDNNGKDISKDNFSGSSGASVS